MRNKVLILTIIASLVLGTVLGAQSDNSYEYIRKLYSGIPAERVSAMEMIAKTKPDFLIPVLKEKISLNRDLEIKMVAIEALKKYPVRTMVPFWINLWKNEESFPVKKSIIDFLSQSGDRRIVLPLVEELGNPFSTIRQSAIQALDRLGDDRMFPHIFNMAKNPNPIFRVYALEAIYHLYDRRMSALVVDLLGDENKSVRYYTLKCIEHNRLKETIGRVRNIALNDNNDEVRIKAIEVIREFRDAGSLYVLLRCLTDGNRNIRYSAAITLLEYRSTATAYQVSTQLDVETDRRIKDTLLEILIRIRNGGGFKGLERSLLHDPSVDLRIKAAYAIGAIGDPRGLPLLLKGLEDKDYRIRAETCASLAVFRNHYTAVSGLMEAVNNDSRLYVRTAALYSLQKIFDRRVLLPLFDLYCVETDPVFKYKLGTVVRTFMSR